jgi:chorismate-pyruvate lyase
MTGSTAQEIDPLSGITARIFVVAVSIVAVTVAGALTVLSGSETSSFPLVALGLGALVAAFVVLIRAADPYRRRVTRAAYGISFSLVLVACILESLGQSGTDTDVRNDWGPIAVALVLMVSGSYRPPGEIVVRTLIATVVVAATTLLHVDSLRSGLLTSLTMAGVLVVALGGGAAIFSSSLIAGLRADRQRAAEAREHRDLRDRRRAIEEFLGNDTESLRREVLPFFREVKARDILTDADRERAAELARILRATLESSLAIEPLERLVARFSDPRAVAPSLSDEQRTALRTVLLHFGGDAASGVQALSLAFDRAGEQLTGELCAEFGDGRSTPGAGAAPFIGLMQLAFTRVDAQSAEQSLTIRFII